MKIVQIGAFAATVASLSATSHGYTFSDTSTVEPEKKRTDLTINTENHIYGGTDGDIADYPSLVSLRVALLDQTFCAGALIDRWFVLTAAHCIRHKEFDIIATFGTNKSVGSDARNSFSVPIATGFRHPGYRKAEHLYDVGLFKLAKPVDRPLAKLCAVDGSDNQVGTMGTVAGWGKTEDSGENGSDVLQELQLPIISNAECAKFEKYVGRVTEGMLCAGTGNGMDTCNGDSGGPFYVDHDILVGCVSWGSTCGQQPGIFTRLTYVMDYIEDILSGGDGSKFGGNNSSSTGSDSSDNTPSAQQESQPDEMGSDSGQIDAALQMDMLKSTLGSDSIDPSSLIHDSDTDADVVASGSDSTVPTKGGLEPAYDMNPVQDDEDNAASKDVYSVQTIHKNAVPEETDLLLANNLGSNSEDLLGSKGDKAVEGDSASKVRKTLHDMIQSLDQPQEPTSESGSAVQDDSASKVRKALQDMIQNLDLPEEPTSESGSTVQNESASKVRKALQIMIQNLDVSQEPTSDSGSAVQGDSASKVRKALQVMIQALDEPYDLTSESGSAVKDDSTSKLRKTLQVMIQTLDDPTFISGNAVEDDSAPKTKQTLQNKAQATDVLRDPMSDMDTSVLQMLPHDGDAVKDDSAHKTKQTVQTKAQATDVPRDPTSDMDTSVLQMVSHDGDAVEDDSASNAKKTGHDNAQTTNVPRDPTSHMDYSIDQMDTAEQVSVN